MHIRRNIKLTQRFRKPLTVIEFSLTEASKQALKKELEPFVNTQNDDGGNLLVLKRAMKKYFPAPVIDYFRELNPDKASAVPPFIYVVHNLPEESAPATAPAGRRGYADLIAYGIELATGYERTGDGYVDRHYLQKRSIEGGLVHKHGGRATILAGVDNMPGTQTPTAFYDLPGAFEAVRQHGCAGGALHSGSHTYKPEELTQAGLTPEVAKDFSQEIAIGKGDMAMWSEHGRVYHQALPTKIDPEVEKTLRPNDNLRRIFFASLDKPTPSR